MREGQKTKFARILRSNMTDAEKHLWNRIRRRQLNTQKFRRQSPVGPYVADFLCADHRLIVELDGGQHDAATDVRRTALLEAQGYRVLRFSNHDVLTNTDGVLETIARHCETLTLDYAARYLRRRALTTDGGTRVVIDLPDARLLQDGETIDCNGTPITIRAADEDLLEVTGDTLPRIAWHIGNRHTPCQVEDARLLIQRDHVLRDMLEKLGATVREVCEPFHPEGGAYGHGRTHGHSHSHDAHEDPNAHLHAHE